MKYSMEAKPNMVIKAINNVKLQLLQFGYNIYVSLYKYFPDNMVNSLNYYHVFRRFPNINNPKRYTEKIQWYKLYGKLERYCALVDKYEVRDFVALTVGKKYLIPIIGVWDDFDEIDFCRLPKQFVIKMTHGSGYNIVCTDKAQINLETIRNKLSNWKKENYYEIGRERQYNNCRPKIMIENYLEDQSGELIDYKIFCFNGNPAYIQVDLGRTTNHTRAFYDIHWNRLPFTTYYPLASRNVIRPENLDELLTLAEKLSKDLLHVRVDLYNPDGKAFFGELTFAHGNGFEPFYPDEWDMIVGNQFEIP